MNAAKEQLPKKGRVHVSAALSERPTEGDYIADREAGSQGPGEKVQRLWDHEHQADGGQQDQHDATRHGQAFRNGASLLPHHSGNWQTG